MAIVDSGGNLMVEYKYNAWGWATYYEGTLKTTLGTLNPFRYRGYIWDEETALYYLRMRYYAPELGRFINSDPIRYGGNWFAYTHCNPINKLDTDGCMPTPLEAAMMATHIYYCEPGGGTAGWVLDEVFTGGTNMKMGVYSREIDGDKEYALVNRGTEPESLLDWLNNTDALTGLIGPDMSTSIMRARAFVRGNPDAEITFVGHSKGGAEAIANALVTGMNCITFNPRRVEGALRFMTFAYQGEMTHYVNNGDMLNGLLPVNGLLKLSVGRVVRLPGLHKPDDYNLPWWQYPYAAVLAGIDNHNDIVNPIRLRMAAGLI